MSKIIDKNIKNGVVVVSTEGYFNKDLGEALKEITDKEIKDGHKSFLINLDQSKIVNSIGASILIEIIEELQTVDGSLNFCNLAPIIAKTFKIMGLTKYCETFDDEDAALQKLA
jgi:anti-anti-sigma factor